MAIERVNNVNKTGRVLTVTIANGAAVSTDLYASSMSARVQGFRALTIITPAAWTAADIGLQVSTDGSTWHTLRNSSGTIVKITGVATAAAGAYVSPDAWGLAGAVRYVRFISLDTADNTNENQGGARTLTVLVSN